MQTLSITSVGMFIFVLITQILAVALLPRTAAFTDPVWTVACLGVYAVSLWVLAYLLHSGAPLSLLIPVLAATVPLATIFVGVLVYNEAASLLKIAILGSACALIGVASMVK